jgi:hypothetical protein
MALMAVLLVAAGLFCLLPQPGRADEGPKARPGRYRHRRQVHRGGCRGQHVRGAGPNG